MRNFIICIWCAFFLSSCDCSHSTCDCFSECEDAVNFTFSADSLSAGFKRSETDTIIVYKFPKGQANALDSVILTKGSSQYGYQAGNGRNLMCGYSSGVSLNDYGPFGDGSFANFDYRIKVPRLKVYTITDIAIKGHESGGKCCSCYDNDKKHVLVDGVAYNLTEKSSKQEMIILRK